MPQKRNRLAETAKQERCSTPIQNKIQVPVEEAKEREKAVRLAKNVPKRDGSGKGQRANRGRGGCKKTRKKGKR